MGQILGFFSDYVKPWKPPRSQSFCLPPNSLFENVGFFDGVYKDEVYEGGATIFLPENFSFYTWLTTSAGKNTKAEVVDVWALLYFVASLNISIMHVFVNSKCVVYWLSRKDHLRVLSLKHWMECI